MILKVLFWLLAFQKSEYKQQNRKDQIILRKKKVDFKSDYAEPK